MAIGRKRCANLKCRIIVFEGMFCPACRWAVLQGAVVMFIFAAVLLIMQALK